MYYLALRETTTRCVLRDTGGGEGGYYKNYTCVLRDTAHLQCVALYYGRDTALPYNKIGGTKIKSYIFG